MRRLLPFTEALEAGKSETYHVLVNVQKKDMFYTVLSELECPSQSVDLNPTENLEL